MDGVPEDTSYQQLMGWDKLRQKTTRKNSLSFAVLSCSKQTNKNRVMAFIQECKRWEHDQLQCRQWHCLERDNNILLYHPLLVALRVLFFCGHIAIISVPLNGSCKQRSGEEKYLTVPPAHLDWPISIPPPLSQVLSRVGGSLSKERKKERNVGLASLGFFDSILEPQTTPYTPQFCFNRKLPFHSIAQINSWRKY